MKNFIACLLAFVATITPVCAQRGNTEAPGLGWNKGGQSASYDLPYVTLSNQPGLSAERALSTHSSFPELLLNDTGANGYLELRWSGQLDIARGGTGGATAAAALVNLIGTPTAGKLLVGNGSAWVAKSVGTNGYVLAADSAAGDGTGVSWTSSGLGPGTSEYLVLSLDAGLSAERRFVAGTGLSATNGGANGDYTLAIDTAVVTTLTGAVTLTNKTLTSPIIGTSIVLDNGSNDITLSWSSSAARAYTIPDVADASFIMSQGAQTKAGVLTLSSAPVLSTATVTTNGDTLTFEDLGNANICQSEGAQTWNGVKTYGNQPIFPSAGIRINASSNYYVISPTAPAAARTYNLYDAGGNHDVAIKSGTPTAGTVAVGDGNKITFTSQGTSGQYLKSQGSSAPTWGNIATFGGDGSDSSQSLTTSSVAGPKQYNATTFSTTAANTITYTTASPIIVNCSSTFTNNGTMTLTGIGYSGGIGAAAGIYHGQSGGGPNGGTCFHSVGFVLGGGGGGGGAAGGRGGPAPTVNAGGAPGGVGVASALGGGGGGAGGGADGSSGAGGAGGAGGGTLLVCAVGAISNASGATINALGGAGSNASASSAAGGGGGGGGNVWLVSQTSADNSGTINVTGGAGGNDNGTGAGGGGGGGGNIYRWSPSNTGSGTFTLTGGAAGTGDNNGSAGSNSTATAITGTPNLPLLAWVFDEGGEQRMTQIARLHQQLSPGSELQISQRVMAREASHGDIALYAKYMSPDWEGTSTVCDAAAVRRDAA